MPRPRRSNLSQRSRNAIRQRNIASQLSDEEREIAREERRVSMEQRRALIRASQTQEQREVARETARLETRNRRAYRTDEQRNNLVQNSRPFQRTRLVDTAVPTIFLSESTDVTDQEKIKLSRITDQDENKLTITTDQEDYFTVDNVNNKSSVSEGFTSNATETTVYYDGIPLYSDTVVSINNIFTFKCESDDISIILPTTWTVSEFQNETKYCWIFSYIRIIPNLVRGSPIIERNVIIEANGNIVYNIHGKRVEISEVQRLIRPADVELLPDILLRFQEMKVCEGNKITDKTLLQGEPAYTYIPGYWHSNLCKLLTEKIRCEICSRLQKTVLQRRARRVRVNSILQVASKKNI